MPAKKIQKKKKTVSAKVRPVKKRMASSNSRRVLKISEDTESPVVSPNQTGSKESIIKSEEEYIWEIPEPVKKPTAGLLILLLVPILFFSFVLFESLNLLVIYILNYCGIDSQHTWTITGFVLMGINLIGRGIRKKGGPTALPNKLEPAYGGFGRRTGALIVDISIIWFLTFGAWYLIPGCFGLRWFSSVFSTGLLAAEAAMLKLFGQTPGKMLMGLKVIGIDTRPITWKQAILRNSPGWFMNLCPLLGIPIALSLIERGPDNLGSFGSVVFLFGTATILGRMISIIWNMSEPIVLLSNFRKRALHDYLAGTVVVVLRKNESISPLAKFALCLAVVATIGMAVNALSHLQHLAESGVPGYRARYARQLWQHPAEGQDKYQALEWCKVDADSGDPESQEELGELYDTYEGIYNQEDSTKYFRLAALQGNFKAIGHLVKKKISW